MQLHSRMWTHAVVCSGKEKKEYYMCTVSAHIFDEKSGTV